MISLLKILNEINNSYDRVNAVLQSIEPISIQKGEQNEINRFVQQVLEYLPEGVTVDEVSNNLPEDLPQSTFLKILIKLSQNKLINFIGGDMKMTPMQILKIYGNAKDVVGKEHEFSLNESNPCWKGYKQIGMKQKGKREVPNCVPINELEINNPVDIKKELLNYLNKAINIFRLNLNKGKIISNSMSIGWIFRELIRLSQQIENEIQIINEAKYQGRTVQLNKPMQGDTKKFKVYVKNPKTGKIVKVNFGAKGMNIKKNNPKNKKAYCSRSKGIKGGGKDKTKANYWSRKMWNCK